MQDGRIVEVGTHAGLLANRSLYYHLYKAQFEHALSMPMPDEWGHGEETGIEDERRSEERLALATG